jgi:hypothetical protein
MILQPFPGGGKEGLKHRTHGQNGWTGIDRASNAGNRSHLAAGCGLRLNDGDSATRRGKSQRGSKAANARTDDGDVVLSVLVAFHMGLLSSIVDSKMKSVQSD